MLHKITQCMYFDCPERTAEEIGFSACQSADWVFVAFQGVLQVKCLDIPYFNCLVR